MSTTAAQRANGREAILHWWREVRPTRPRCGAKARTTGEACRHIAMANGKCHLHGGRTPKGDGWRKPQWPKANSPGAEDKLQRKLRDLDRAERKRQARLAGMTDDERQRYLEWRRTHRPGPAAARVRDKANRQAARGFAAVLEKADRKQRSPELIALDRLLDEAKRHAAALEKNDLGIFG